MARTEHRNLQRLTKKITKLVLSVYVFSFFLSYLSWYSFFLHSMKLHFSTFSSHILSQTMNKNCIFLICNGILVFLAKTSGFPRFSPPDNLADQLLEKLGDEDESQISPVMKEYSLLGKDVSTEYSRSQENVILRQNDDGEEEEQEYSIEVESDPHEGSNLIVEDKEQEVQTGFFIRTGQEDDQEEEEEKEEDWAMSDEEVEDSNDELKTQTRSMMEEHIEDDIRLLSTDELNKKCDEFIRRMKEEIRIGAEQQLILAQ
ncbi:hypothetical protein NMG60_11037372 [Bertholletia excelsa]